MTLLQLLRFCGIFLLVINSMSYAQDTARIREHLTQLCSPAMSGRGYVQGGDSIAAAYIANHFQQLALKHWGKNYYQPFTMPINTFPDKAMLIINKKSLQVGTDFLLKPSSGGGAGEANLLHLDTLVWTDKKKAKKFFKQKIENYVIVFRQKDYPKLLSLPDEYIKKIYTAKAIIELTDNKLTASLAPQQYPMPVFEVKESVFNEVVSKVKSKAKVTWSVTAILKEKHATQNVIGYVEGKTKPDSFLVFTAHYDHVGRMGKDVYFPGGNDNASGTAFLLELANYYAANPSDYSVVFMAFAGEEAGLLGSKYYCERPLFSLKKIQFLINLDLLGTGNGLMVVNATLFPTYFQRLDSLNQSQQFVPELRKRGKAANSDHYFFTENGVSCFYTYTLETGAGYHDVNDKPEKIKLHAVPKIFQLLTKFYETF